MKLLQGCKCLCLLLIANFSCALASEPATEIPFELVDDIIYINLEVNGVDGLRFIFDTGAGITLISDKLGERLNLSRGATATNTGAAGKSTVETFSGNVVRIGDLKKTDVIFARHHGKIKGGVLQEEVDGVIGYDVLSNWVVSIDYDSLKLELFDFDRFEIDDRQGAIDFDIFSNIPFIRASLAIGGRVYHGKYLIDTGAEPALILSTAMVKKNNLLEKLPESYEFSTDVGTSNTMVDLVVGMVDYVKFADFYLKEVPTIFSKAEQGVLSLSQFQGIIGNAVLKRFNATYHYRLGKLLLQPNDIYGQAFEVDCLGVLFDKSDGVADFKVESVISDSPAEMMGLVSGDQIIEMNNRAILDYTHDQFSSILHADGTIVSLAWLRNGQQLEGEVTLRRLIH